MPNKPNKRGYFITLEGIEGVGKSTQQKFIYQYLTDKHISVVTTREPGGTPLANQIRQVLLSHEQEELTREAELLLLFAGRSQHIKYVIEPALAEQWVVCDRFTDTTYAYQGSGRGIPMERIAELESWIQGDLRPDLVLVFDAPVDIALKRIQYRGHLDRIENEQADFFERARTGFLNRARQFPQSHHIIDASASMINIQTQIKAILDRLLTQYYA